VDYLLAKTNEVKPDDDAAWSDFKSAESTTPASNEPASNEPASSAPTSSVPASGANITPGEETRSEDN
jgi:hypothetical protein